MSSIERIENAGPDFRARRLFLSDFDEPLVTSASVVRALSLAVGDEVERDALAQSIDHTAGECARERTFRLLGSRERSQHELLKKLRDDGYGSELCEEVVSRMIELGLVDDERFAGMWVRSRAAAGLGRQRILSELKQKGIDPGLAARTLDEQLGSSEIERARLTLASTTPPADRKQRERLIRRLVTRGYTLGVASAAVSELGRDE